MGQGDKIQQNLDISVKISETSIHVYLLVCLLIYIYTYLVFYIHTYSLTWSCNLLAAAALVGIPNLRYLGTPGHLLDESDSLW